MDYLGLSSRVERKGALSIPFFYWHVFVLPSPINIDLLVTTIIPSLTNAEFTNKNSRFITITKYSIWSNVFFCDYSSSFGVLIRILFDWFFLLTGFSIIPSLWTLYPIATQNHGVVFISLPIIDSLLHLLTIIFFLL